MFFFKNPIYFYGMDKNCSSKYLPLYSTETKSHRLLQVWNDFRHPFNPYEFFLPFMASPFHEPPSPYITDYILYWGKKHISSNCRRVSFLICKSCCSFLSSIPGEHLSPIRSLKVVRTKLASGWLRCPFWATQTSHSWVTETAKWLRLSPLAFSSQSA